MPNITQAEITSLRTILNPLIGLKMDWLSIPDQALEGFEPSQIAVIVNTLLDGILPQIQLLATTEDNKTRLHNIGLQKANDVLLIAAAQLKEENGFCSPFIVDIEVFSMVECLTARDKRLYDTGGKWISGLPKVISNAGQRKMKTGQILTDADYEKDTNFGKLKRIPYKPLQDFLNKWAS
jgi:hypothetical protein